MSFFSKLFKSQSTKYPEDYYEVTINNEFIKVEHPRRKTEKIYWKDIVKIDVMTTDDGPVAPDFYLVLIGENSGCTLPQGAPHFDDIYNIISKYEGFNFTEWMKASGSIENARFNLWTKPI